MGKMRFGCYNKLPTVAENNPDSASYISRVQKSSMGVTMLKPRCHRKSAFLGGDSGEDLFLCLFFFFFLNSRRACIPWFVTTNKNQQGPVDFFFNAVSF